ncbi:class II fructose-bisphosphate aldolase family protein [Streptomyces sp. GMY02]|uniref:class II fructose-bisphosphate aldolase n=1 Tax=Streptomyces sp. GMY02 TaxID=1333528 RepID=UPI001C2C6E04|nr:class II fructose-bisphosphate aldolase [Streptomyces sp. GMY02]QXE36244.1 class II fructose-bisphosphate aldolase family protein [Streptomyces sp. GMY02]
MPLASTGELVTAAAAAGHGIAAFNVITLEHAEAIATGAERAGAPAILQISENAVRFHGGEPRAIAAAAVAIAHASSVPLALHLDHVESADLLRAAPGAGFSSVMFDASKLPYAENLRATADAVRWGHEQGIWVEAELGAVGGKDGDPSPSEPPPGEPFPGEPSADKSQPGVPSPSAPSPGERSPGERSPGESPLTAPALDAHAPGVRTDPAEAAAYTAATGVDALAVAVGSSHAMTRRTAALDHALIAALRAAVPVPLVLHGSSGVPDEEIRRAIAAGMVKINVGTALNAAFTGAVREYLAARPSVVDPRKYLVPAREAMAGTVAGFLRVVGPQTEAPRTAVPRSTVDQMAVDQVTADQAVSPSEA